MELPELWALIDADLSRARSALPDIAASHKTIRQYQQFLEHMSFSWPATCLKPMPRTIRSVESFGMPSAMLRQR
jgi:hypothetical protein